MSMYHPPAVSPCCPVVMCFNKYLKNMISFVKKYDKGKKMELTVAQETNGCANIVSTCHPLALSPCHPVVVYLSSYISI